MAFGKQSSNATRFPAGTKLYYAQVKQKKDGKYLPAPIWVVQQKGEDKQYVTIDDGAKFLSGNLVEIKNRKQKTKEGKEIESVSATFQDGNQIVFATLQHDYLGWNIMNSLLALGKSHDDIEIGLYQSKPKKPGDKTYASAAVRQDGQLVRGKFDNKDLPAIPKHKIGNDIISDKTARTAFFVAQIEELSKVLKAKAPAGLNVPRTQESTDNGVSDTGDDTDGAVQDEQIEDPNGGEKLPF